MRFNEKELALFAASVDPDKEGLLEKKGAGKGQGVCTLKQGDGEKTISTDMHNT